MRGERGEGFGRGVLGSGCVAITSTVSTAPWATNTLLKRAMINEYEACSACPARTSPVTRGTTRRLLT